MPQGKEREKLQGSEETYYPSFLFKEILTRSYQIVGGGVFKG